MTKASKIGVTLGDPCGIGPEIAARALAREAPRAARPIAVYGDLGAFLRAGGAIGENVEFVDVGAIPEGALEREAPPGRPGLRAGEAQVAYLEAAARAAGSGELAGLVTAPIHKGWARAAGLAHPGHTEFFAERLGADRVAMMFAGPRLKVALATIHVPIAEVPRALTRERVETAIELLVDSLGRDFGLSRPRVGVLGLNPHAGEGGELGREEQDVVGPAIRAAAERVGDRASIEGPLVPDAAFRGAIADPGGAGWPAAWDALVALYHDQGLIPIKLVDFDEAVNLTLGLPIPRTSPDHGVAYDIAGSGRARAESFCAALRLADDLASRRERAGPGEGA